MDNPKVEPQLAITGHVSDLRYCKLAVLSYPLHCGRLGIALAVITYRLRLAGRCVVSGRCALQIRIQSRWIGIRQWVVQSIGILVKRLQILQVAAKRIGRHEATHARAVVPGPEVVES